MIELSEHLAQEDFPEATVIRIRVRQLTDYGQIQAIQTALLQLVESGTDRLILDMTEVAYLSSASLGMFINLRKRLSARGKTFKPPCGRRGLFTMLEDEATAIEAIRGGETEPILLCGVRPDIKEVFRIC